MFISSEIIHVGLGASKKYRTKSIKIVNALNMLQPTPIVKQVKPTKYR